jgi:HTH-type transcriptional regulator, sugar sensing transcriptional regulator
MIKEKQLELLGLNNKEARLYISALELGSFSVLEVAAKSGLKRPTCYIVLEELIKRGFISMILSDKKKLYRAESPTNFIRQAKNNLKYAEQIVPSLLAIASEDKEKPKMKYYFGQKGMQNIYDDLLITRSKMMYYISSTQSQIETVGEEFLKDYAMRRIEKGIKVKTIRMRKTQSNEPLFNGSKEMQREVRYAPENVFIPDTVCVIGTKVAVVFTVRGNFGFIIDSPEFSQTILGLFKVLWNASTEN